jgi:class 3 adenylate cyclase
MGKNLNDSTTSSTTDDTSHKKKKIEYINISSLSWKEKISLLTKNKYFQSFILILTIIILILGDVHKIASINSDLTFNIIHAICSFLTFIEIILYFISDESYGFSFYFFMDIIFLISIIFEITNVYDSIIYREGEDYLRTNMDMLYFVNLMKAVRIFRIVRIGKIVTMFNYIFLEKQYDNSNRNNIGEGSENISTAFMNYSSYKVFLFYVLLIVAQIVFSQELYEEDQIFDKSAAIHFFSDLRDLTGNKITKLVLFTTVLEAFSRSEDSLIYARINQFIYINDTFNEKLRKSEQLIFHQSLNDSLQNDAINSSLSDLNDLEKENYEINKELLKRYISEDELYRLIYNKEKEKIKNFLLLESESFKIKFINDSNMNEIFEKQSRLSNLNLLPSLNVREHKNILIFDNRYQCIIYHEFNIIRTLFSIAIFLFVYILFLSDINNVILISIEKMVKKVEKMAKNPSLELDNSLENSQNKSHCLSFLEASQGDVKMDDFKIIINKISKICSLVSLGFGEAGTQIISQVLKKGLNVDINPLIPGKKVMGIYGFCDIRNFTDTTEILKENVMIFVNQVAEIVHQITADYCGSANKNIGDAFLLVWKLEDQFIKEIVNKKGVKELKLKNVNRINQICDMVLICFIRILIEINKSYKLAEYRHHKGLNARMKNYKTRLGFGLHLGQSIEGAIGSMFKIDASYLSTNVNMANELEENTKTFKKELIMSGDFYDYLSEDAKRYVRLLDIFKTKSGEITRLYSIDLDLECIQVEKKKDSMFKENNAEKKMEIIKQKRKMAKILYDDIVIRHKSDIWNEFVTDEDEFRLVREKYPDEFVDIYNSGMEAFKKGSWEEAKKLLTNAQELINGDDPACKINLEFMEKYNYTAPNNWKGYKDEGED